MGIPQWETGGVGPKAQELSPWDTLVLGGKTLPGRARVHSRRGRKHDRKGGPGADGETFTDLGSQAAELDISITLVDADEMQALVDALDGLLPVPKKTASPGQPVAPVTLTYTDGRLLSSTGDAVGPWDPLQIAEDYGFPVTVAADQGFGGIPYPDAILNPNPAKFGPSTVLASQNSPTLRTGQGAAGTPVQPAGQTSTPLSIMHPSLARLRVRSVIIVEEEGFQPGPEKGTFEWKARAVEWMGKGNTKVIGTANGASTANPGNVPVTPALPLPSDADTGP